MTQTYSTECGEVIFINEPYWTSIGDLACGYRWVIPMLWGRIVSKRRYSNKYDARFYRNQALSELRVSLVTINGCKIYVSQDAVAKAAYRLAEAFKRISICASQYYGNDWEGA